MTRKRSEGIVEINTGLDEFEVEFDGDDISITVPQQMLLIQMQP